VAEDSPAVERGVQQGLMILEANGQPIRSAADLKAAVDAAEKAGRASILLLVQQPGGRAFVPVPLKK
jgi:serine protease Do